MNISCPRPRKGGRTKCVSGVSFGNQYWDAVENHPAAVPILKVKSHASEWSLWSRQGNQPIWMFVAARGAEAQQTLRVDYQENRRSQEFGQGGAEAGHCHLGRGRAVPGQVHLGVSRRGPSQAPWTGRVQQTVWARACGWAQGGLCQMHQVPAGLRPTSTRVSGCPRRAHGGKRKIHPFIPLPLELPDPDPPPPSSEMG